MPEYQTVNARPINDEDVARLAAGEEIAVLAASESRRHGVVLTPATADAKYVGKAKVRNVGAAVEQMQGGKPSGTYKHDNGNVVGHRVDFTVKTMFGTEWSGSRFDNQAAREAARLCGNYSHTESSRDLYVEDPEGEPMRLMPVWGAEVNTVVMIEGMDPEEAQALVTSVLRAEFGDRARFPRTYSRPVKDIRVDVWDQGFDDGSTPVAVNVLQAEAHLYARRGVHRTMESDPALVIGR